MSGESDGLCSVQIRVHRDGSRPSSQSPGVSSASLLTETPPTMLAPPQNTGQPVACQLPNPAQSEHGVGMQVDQSGYLLPTPADFSGDQSHMHASDGVMTVADLSSDHPDAVDSSTATRPRLAQVGHPSMPASSGYQSLQTGMRRVPTRLRSAQFQKESLGRMKRRLLQEEHDLRLAHMREEHTWLLEEHKWKREEHELRMNMIRLNSKI